MATIEEPPRCSGDIEVAPSLLAASSAAEDIAGGLPLTTSSPSSDAGGKGRWRT